MHIVRAVCFVLLAGCSTNGPAPVGTNVANQAHPTPIPRTTLVGVWSRALPNGESHRLTLFDSGVMAFQHVGAKLPISQSVGRWSFADGALQLDIVGNEPEGTAFPFANRLVAAIPNATTLELDGGERSTWAAVPKPYGVEPGVKDRAAQDESSWTSLVETAERTK